MASIWFDHKKRTEDKNQKQSDRHADTPSEAYRDKHIDFPDVEQDSATQFVIHKQDAERQKDWENEIEEGKEERSRSENPPRPDSPMRMDGDETLGVP